MCNSVYSFVEVECAIVSTLLWNSGVPLCHCFNLFVSPGDAQLQTWSVMHDCGHALRSDLQLQLELLEFLLTVRGSLS